MTSDTTILLAELSRKATPGPWEADAEPTDGSYGSGEDTHEGFDAYTIYSTVEQHYGKPAAIMGTENSGVGEIHEESDEDSFRAWDEKARCNTAFVVALVNAYRAGQLVPARQGGAAGQPVTLTYTNWRGETAEREIMPTGRVLFTSNEWHPEPQWLVEARDARSGEVRLFALKGFGGHNEGLDGHTTLKDDGRLLRAWMKEAGCTPSMMQADRDIWKTRAEAALAAVQDEAIRRLASPQDHGAVRDAALEEAVAAVRKEADDYVIAVHNKAELDDESASRAYVAGCMNAIGRIRALKTNTDKPDRPSSYQTRVAEWLDRITVDDPTDLAERVHRFSEEAIELAQALGQTRDEAHQLADYVHNQDHVGEPFQEFGGTYSTLAALAGCAAVDLEQTGEAELARISTPEMVAKIREKRSKRHGRGPLPGTYAPDFIPDAPRQDGEPEAGR